MGVLENIANAVDKVIHPNAHLSAEDLGKETVPQLKARAKEAGIKGFDGMKKAELIDALAEKKPDQCPVTDEPCKKDCAIDECKHTDSESIESRPEKSGYASHPKFDKFKSTQGEK